MIVSVAKCDRDVLRFLWFDDVMAEQPNIIELRFTRVVFGVYSSPFLLNATIRHHLGQYRQTHPTLVKKMCQSLYVDDLVTGAGDEDQAYLLFVQSRKMLKDGGFNLRKFCSNSLLLQARVDADLGNQAPNQSRESVELDETYAYSTLGPGQPIRSGEQKVLGVRWNTCSDELVVSLTEIASATQAIDPTKRNIVGLVGRFYDPLGILSPVVV